MKRIVISVTNDLVTDQRVHKVAGYLHAKGADVLLVGRQLPESVPITRLYKVFRMKLWFRKGPIFYGEYNIRLFFFLLFRKVDILVANDLDTLLANFLVSRIRRKELVYDTHEYYTGVPELVNRPLVRKIWECIEAFIFPRLKRIYTVNSSIALLYAEKYNKHIEVVRNMPPRLEMKNWPTRHDLNLPVDKRIIIFQGAGINMNRGAEEAIMAMKYLDDNVKLLIIGGGDVYQRLKELVIEEGLQNRVIFKPRMPYEELMKYTHVSDIGLSLDKDTNINYRFSLPNKLFDYIQAQIPVLCSNLTEVARIVNKWQVGVVITSHNPEKIAHEVNSMLNNEQQYSFWKINLKNAAEILNWENEKHTLEKIYNDLLS